MLVFRDYVCVYILQDVYALVVDLLLGKPYFLQCSCCYRLLDMDHVTGCDYIKHLLMGCLDNLLNKLSQSEDEQGT